MSYLLAKLLNWKKIMAPVGLGEEHSQSRQDTQID